MKVEKDAIRSYKCNKLPDKFDFRSNINIFNILYHAKRTGSEYVITCDSGGVWHYSVNEMMVRLGKGDYVIV